MHFVGGRKTYRNNIPTIVPKTKGKIEQKPRLTSEARNGPTNPQKTASKMEIMNLSIPATSNPIQN